MTKAPLQTFCKHVDICSVLITAVADRQMIYNGTWTEKGDSLWLQNSKIFILPIHRMTSALQKQKPLGVPNFSNFVSFFLCVSVCISSSLWLKKKMSASRLNYYENASVSQPFSSSSLAFSSTASSILSISKSSMVLTWKKKMSW